jgi:hypothetical protein
MNSRTAVTLAVSLLVFSQLMILGQKRNLPPPLRVHVPLEASWETMGLTLELNELPVKVQSRDSGTVTTDFVEYSSGPLTSSHIAKVGDLPKLLDGDWVRVGYQYEISFVFIEEKETLVNVNANVRALKRQFLGGDEWVDISSNGRLEADLLTAFGQLMFGDSFSLEQPKKGYWDRTPGYIQDADIRPRVAGPERKPQQ